jgi:hypothetical protein
LKEVVGRIFIKDSRTLALNEVNFVIIELVNFVAVPAEYAGVQPDSVHCPSEVPGFFRRKDIFL